MKKRGPPHFSLKGNLKKIRKKKSFEMLPAVNE